MKFTCASCEKTTVKPEPFVEFTRWMQFQDTTDIAILPVGECHRCGFPLYDPEAERRKAEIDDIRDKLAKGWVLNEPVTP